MLACAVHFQGMKDCGLKTKVGSLEKADDEDSNSQLLMLSSFFLNLTEVGLLCQRMCHVLYLININKMHRDPEILFKCQIL